MRNISTGGIERLYEELAKNTRLTYQKLCELLALNNTPKVGVDYEGNPTSVSNSILTVPHPESVQLVKFCGTSTEYDKTILCEPITGTKVVIVTAYSQTGVPSSIPYNLLTSTIYSGDISKLEYCNEEIESDPITMCDGGVSFLRWVIKRNGIPTGKLDTLLDGFSPYTTTSTTQTIGECELCTPTISDAFGDDLSTLLEGTSFVITKPDCCKIRLVTSIGSIILREKEIYYSTTDFKCAVKIENIEIITGTCDLSAIHIISNFKG